MKTLRLIIPVAFLILFCSCKKLVQDEQKNALLTVMTNGQWHVETYLEGTIEITTEFTGYNFQFKEDGSVNGEKDSVITTGTWSGDVANYSIISNFPLADNPVKKLNGTWKIKDSNADYVSAEMKTIQGLMILHLRKNS